MSTGVPFESALSDDEALTVDRILRQVAARCLARERPSHTLQLTGVVNEAWLQLARQQDLQHLDPPALKAWASKAIRHILVSYARYRGAAKRTPVETPRAGVPGGGEEIELAPEELLELDEAITALQDAHPIAGRVVELRYFGGLRDREIAALLGVRVPDQARRAADVTFGD